MNGYGYMRARVLARDHAGASLVRALVDTSATPVLVALLTGNPAPGLAAWLALAGLVRFVGARTRA